MAYSSFSSNLRQYAEERKQRYALIVEQAEELGGHPAIVPASLARTPWLWEAELQRRYYNIANFYGWTPLPGYDPNAARFMRNS